MSAPTGTPASAGGAASHGDLVTQIMAALDWSTLDGDLQAALAPALAEVFGAGFAAAGGTAEEHPAVAWAQQRAAESVGMRRLEDGSLVQNPDARWVISDTTREQLRQTIAQGLADGLGPRALAEAVQECGAFSDSRAAMIARSESGLAMTNGAIGAYADQGDTHCRERDGDYDPTCAARDGQIVTLDQTEADAYDEHPNGAFGVEPVTAEEAAGLSGHGAGEETEASADEAGAATATAEGGGRSGGGGTSFGVTTTKAGDQGEAYFMDVVAPDLGDKWGGPIQRLSGLAYPDGSMGPRNLPLDSAANTTTGLEVKTLNAHINPANLKTAIKDEEKARKLADAEARGLANTATILQLVDREARTVEVYQIAGIRSLTYKGMEHVGTWPIPDGYFGLVAA